MTRKKTFLMIAGIIFVFLCFYNVGNTEEKIDRWVYYGTSVFGDRYYDKRSITKVMLSSKVSTKIIRVWEKEKFSKVGKNQIIQSMKDNKLSIDGYEKLDYEITLCELYCLDNTTKLMKIIYYNSEGKILTSYDFPNPQIEHIIPGSISEVLHGKVCPK